MEYKIAPSLLSCDFGHFAKEIEAVEKAGADLLHVDVMDGHFVPNITMGPIMVEAARRASKLPLDTHLMIENARKYINDFILAGSTSISVHIENTNNLKTVLSSLKEKKVKAGIAINPETPVQNLFPYLSMIDYVLIMSVHPGFGGQKFIDGTYKKIEELSKKIKEQKLAVEIAVDGGVNTDNIGKLKISGANIFVAGNAIFKTNNYKETIQKMRAFL